MVRLGGALRLAWDHRGRAGGRSAARTPGPAGTRPPSLTVLRRRGPNRSTPRTINWSAGRRLTVVRARHATPPRSSISETVRRAPGAAPPADSMGRRQLDAPISSAACRPPSTVRRPPRQTQPQPPAAASHSLQPQPTTSHQSQPPVTTTSHSHQAPATSRSIQSQPPTIATRHQPQPPVATTSHSHQSPATATTASSRSLQPVSKPSPADWPSPRPVLVIRRPLLRRSTDHRYSSGFSCTGPVTASVPLSGLRGGHLSGSAGSLPAQQTGPRGHSGETGACPRGWPRPVDCGPLRQTLFRLQDTHGVF